MNRTALAALTRLASTAAFPATAQIDNSKPQPAPFSETIPTPVDTPSPGTITINVDASDTSQGLFKVTQRVPVAAAGPMTFLYPTWLPGHHSPSGTRDKIAGLVVPRGGKVLPVRREQVVMEAISINRPQ